ncbi:efflux RND transporter periplasmic adaptor subunit [Parahaliea mediterranea]|uniref:HlyD family efflux transporter periplasmic adaptor subunit n=1 Tax=Parahaliea mediterranea TaxID=651086 RepID=A0A939DFA6_9GAMM|nr:HlyD family efflux transporter periplasmic adaptor subunit [Parahaliea mediterranea]MBN7796462.1 HlyD family efflux transporter periplasmic adaptor subunit [Parahaliea mediterranea]
MTTKSYNRPYTALWVTLVAALLCTPAQAARDNGGHTHPGSLETNREHREPDKHNEAYARNKESHGDAPAVIILDTELARETGLETRIAGPGSIERHISVYGRLAIPPNQIVQIRARFPGVIRDIRVNVGDPVARDQVLATIESNESLRSYELRSPIAGVVQDRMANIGEITGDIPLFTLVNNDTLWAQLKIFPSLRFEVQPGQNVHINHNGHIHDSHIASVTPGTQGQPYVLARVALQNSRGDMAPGDMVSAQVDAEKVNVSLVVENRALQTLDGQIVIFVKEGDRYTARAVKPGRTDGRFTEVHGGLRAGERYVADNSYLLKAELLKSGASHDH